MTMLMDAKSGVVERRAITGFETFEVFKTNAGINTFTLTDDQVKEVQRVVWSTAQDMIDVCEDNGIEYFLDGGSCLGAIRHQGFIPWDDDIDIAIARTDLDRFMRLFKERFGHKYWIHEPAKTEGFALPVIQIRRKGTLFKGRDDYQNDENGVPIDLYVVENVFNNPVLRIAQGALCNFSQLVLSCRKFAVHSGYYKWFAEGVDSAMKGVKNKVLLGRALGFIPLKTAISFYEKTATMCNDDNSKWVSIPSGWEHFFGGLNKRSMLFPTAKATFEGREVSVPGKYEEYLIGLYGPSYMSLPPEDRREKHVVAAFDLGGNADSEQSA